MSGRRVPAVAAAIVAMAIAPPALASHTLVVDKDKAQCPSAGFTSIQAAVNAADPGSTILVCPDTYNEAVLIAGPGKNDLQIQANGNRADVVLDGLDALENGFRLRNVSGVLIEGFTVQRYHDDIWLETDANENTIRGNDLRFAFGHDGVVVTGHRNLIVGNIAHDNRADISCGISLGTGASNNVVRNNETYMNPNVGILLGGGLLGPAGPGNAILNNFVHDNGKPFPGVTGGNGILNNSPRTLIVANRVQDNNRNGILLTGAVVTDTVVSFNEVVRNGSTIMDDGIRLTGGPSGNSITFNFASFNRHDGIHLTGANNNLVANNLGIDNGTPEALNGCGVDLDGGSANNVVRNNRLLFHDRAGIRLQNSGSGNLVRDNEVRDNPGDGIQLVNADSNRIEQNESRQNGTDGIHADVNSTGNTIERNRMRANAAFDCRDDSVGTGTAGTANFWINNTGQTENRPGLCIRDGGGGPGGPIRRGG